MTGRAFSWGTNYCGELGNGTYEVSNEPQEIQLSENEKFISIVAGNAFTLGLTLPLSSHTKRSTVIDEVKIGPEESFHEASLPTPIQPSRYTFNTLEIPQTYEKPQSIHSQLSSSRNMTSTTSFRTSVPFSPVKQPVNQDVNSDICYQNRAARAAALERQFQSILHKYFVCFNLLESI